jgi:hypothetical protein
MSDEVLLGAMAETFMDSDVNSPSHYNQGDVECIDAIRAALGAEGFKHFCQGQVIKYTWRLGLKESGTKDAKKAQWYGAWLVGTDPRS